MLTMTHKDLVTILENLEVTTHVQKRSATHPGCVWETPTHCMATNVGTAIREFKETPAGMYFTWVKLPFGDKEGWVTPVVSFPANADEDMVYSAIECAPAAVEVFQAKDHTEAATQMLEEIAEYGSGPVELDKEGVLFTRRNVEGQPRDIIILDSVARRMGMAEDTPEEPEIDAFAGTALAANPRSEEMTKEMALAIVAKEEARKARSRERRAKRRENESPEEKAARLEKKRESRAARRAKESPEQKEARLARNRARKENRTPEQKAADALKRATRREARKAKVADAIELLKNGKADEAQALLES